MKFNFRLIVNILGFLLLFNGIFMLLCLPVSFIYEEDDWKALLISAAISIFTGLAAWFFTKESRKQELRKKEGYLAVALGWIVLTLSGSLPFAISGAIPDYVDAFFETMSGYTTTGASILDDIEGLSKGIIFWRSFTSFIGGMGIVVLAVAIMPILGIGGMQLYSAEAPALMPDKIRPRIRETAKRLWLIYVGFVVVQIVVLKMAGMGLFDAINHSFCTVSTCGFSPREDSIGYYNSPLIEYIIIVFMILGGTNFAVAYMALQGRFKKVWRNDEFRFYLGVLAVFSCIVAASILQNTNAGVEESIRKGLFHVVSIVTTTGFTTENYLSWGQFTIVIFFMLMFTGACAGSTSGGVKMVRHLILLKNTLLEFKRQLHPSAVLPVRFNNMAISQDTTFSVLAFMMIYVIIFVIGSLVMSILGLDFDSAFGAVASCLGNVGPGIGTVGPLDNFHHVPTAGKWVLSFYMLLGRLELFTVIILFTPFYWKRL